MEIQPKTIFVVDDEEMIRQLVETVLHGAGYRVLLAKDGDEARERIYEESIPIDLLVTDLCMPGLSGDQVALIFQKKWPHSGVLFASGSCSQWPPECFELIRNTKFLFKPYIPRQLLALIREFWEEQAKAAVFTPN